MTREEKALIYFKNLRNQKVKDYSVILNTAPKDSAVYGAVSAEIEIYDIAIKAIEQEPILDKIRAEIESKREEVSNKNSENNELQAFFHGLNDGLKDARDIIEKYKTGGSCK